jgi:glycosyltransferase involved in cell wall biosynthesis
MRAEPRTVLSVAFPFAPVGPSSVGGSERVLALLDRALAQAGHRSLVVAAAGSEVAGSLFAIPQPKGRLDEAARERGHRACRAAIAAALASAPVDLLHFHGLDFASYLPPAGPPALVTLHLPPSWYPPEALRPARPRTFLHCVSAAQRRACPPDLELLPEVENGVDLQQFRPIRRKRGYVLALGRICEEKGLHFAIDAATRAGFPLLLGGKVFPYAEHERYFRAEIAPRLKAPHRFLGPLPPGRKARLLAAARCLLIPSLAPETSSLVAMEALASGTPVIAFPAGALPEIVEPGRTGFLVDGVEAMAEAIREVERIDPAACRRAAEERFSSARTIAGYFALYDRLIERGQSEVARCG